MYAYSVLHPPSSITGAVWTKIEAAGRRRLVVARTRALEIYSFDIQLQQLSKLYTVEMGSAILGLAADESRVPSRVITLLEDGSVFAWQWALKDEKLVHSGTCVVKAFHKYEGQSLVTRGNNTVVLATNGNPQQWITPRGTTALKVSFGYGGVGIPVSTAFANDGLLAVLYRDSLNSVGLAYVSEELKGASEIGCSSDSEFAITDTASLLVSVTFPCNGVLVVSETSVLYYPPYSKKVSGTYKFTDEQLLRVDFPKSLVVSAASKMHNGVVVLSSDVGDVAIVTLAEDAASLDVAMVEKPADSALQFPPTSLVRMDGGVFFAASHHDNSVVFRLSNSDSSGSSGAKRRRFWSYEEQSIIANIAPINDMALKAGPLQQTIVYAACGGYTSGSVSKLYTAVDPVVEEQIPLGEGADKVWWFDEDRALFVRYMTHCAILILDEGSLVELDAEEAMERYGFVLEEPLWVGELDGEYVQVSESGVRSKGKHLAIAATTAILSDALLVAAGADLYTLTSMDSLPEPQRLESAPWSYAKNGSKTYVSYLNGGTFELGGEQLFSESASSMAVSNGFTVLGFANGDVRVLEAGFSRRLGLSPVSLVRLWDSRLIAYSSDGVGAIDLSGGDENLSNCMAPFIEGTIPLSVSCLFARERVSYIVGGDLFVADVPAPSLAIVSEQFNALVRRICLVLDNRIVVGMAERDIDAEGAESVQYRLVLLSQDLKVLDMLDLKPFESLESLISHKGKVYVGTGMDGKDRPTNGRLLELAVAGDKLKVVAEKQLPGCAYSLSVSCEPKKARGPGKEHLVVGCNAVLDDLELEDDHEFSMIGQTKTPTLALRSAALDDSVIVGDLVYGYRVYRQTASKLEPLDIKSSEPMFPSAVELVRGGESGETLLAMYSRSDGTVGINNGDDIVEQKLPDKMLNAIRRVPKDSYLSAEGAGTSLAVCAGVEGGIYLISEVRDEDSLEGETGESTGETPSVGENGFVCL